MRPPTKGEPLALVLVPDTLTSEERRMLTRYRATAPEWRADIVDYANTVAKMFPLERAPRPATGQRIRLASVGDKEKPS